MRLDSDQDPDRQIRGLFEDIHRRETPPPFHRLWRGRETARDPRRWVPSPGFAVSAVALLLALTWIVWQTSLATFPPVNPPTDTPMVAAVAIESWASWQGPLDFLLQIPGSDLLESIPSFTPDAFALDVPELPPETNFTNPRKLDHDV